MVWVGKDLKDHLVPTPLAMSRDIFSINFDLILSMRNAL